MSAPITPLCIADDATFWPWRRWPEFAHWADPAGTVVVVPLAGTADWGLGHPLDVEETVLLHVLRAASLGLAGQLPLLMIPPLRFVLGPVPGCAFAVDPPVAHALLNDVLGSIAASGFRRVVLYNSSPWNEELIAASARDNRITHGLQIFRISLSGLGLDLHPTRSRDRRKFQTLATALLGSEPEPDSSGAPAPRGWADETVDPLPGPAVPLATALDEAPAILKTAADLLASLLGEIHARPPLRDNGVVPRADSGASPS